MDIYNKTQKLAIKLTTETNANKIKWVKSLIPASFIDGTEYKFPFCYTCKYKEQKIGIYEKRYKHFTDVDEYFWTAEIGLFFLNSYGDSVTWSYAEQSKIFLNLFESVVEQSSNIGNLLDSLLE